ncbi:MAG: trypsin-like peptidase domain-containing protein [Pirellulaceae bacterium]
MRQLITESRVSPRRPSRPLLAARRIRLLVCCWLVGVATASIALSPGLAAEPVKSSPAESRPAASSPDVGKIFAGQAPTSAADLAAMQEKVQQLAEHVIPCTVNVQIGRPPRMAQGSGVIISKDGYVMTAAHVNGAPGRDVVFTFADGSTAKGKTLGVDRRIDAGLMKITDEGEWPHLEIGDSKSLKSGQWVLATGHPGGYQKGRKPVVRLGRVLLATNGVVMTDCTLVGGDSGGPLFDMDGKVVAIHSRISSGISENMHVPANTYTEHWDELAAGDIIGIPTQPYIGVNRDLESDEARIAAVVPESPAEKSGIKAGDVITRFDGKQVPNFDVLAELVMQKDPGDKVKVEVKRGDDTFLLDLVVGKLGK